MAERLHPEHQDLLQFLYEVPIGVIDMTDGGEVNIINPAASRLLTPEVERDESVANPLPILRRLAPELMNEVRTNPERLGMISTGRGAFVDGRDGTTRFSVSAHRVRRGHIVVSLTDVTEERRMANEQRVRAQRLQRALLGSIDLTTLEISVAYQPAHRGDLSGGDWYDVIAIDDDRFALVVGDVVGHDVEASATMGQLRSIIRAFALIDPDPNNVLDRTESLAQTIEGASCATVHYSLLDQAASTVTYASAGHPPPLIIRGDGSIDLLVDGRQAPLAAIPSRTTRSATVALMPGDVLVVYTDGLVERRGESIDVGIDRLRSAAAGLRAVESIDEFVERLTQQMLEGTNHEDDVCVLAVRHTGTATT